MTTNNQTVDKQTIAINTLRETDQVVDEIRDSEFRNNCLIAEIRCQLGELRTSISQSANKNDDHVRSLENILSLIQIVERAADDVRDREFELSKKLSNTLYELTH